MKERDLGNITLNKKAWRRVRPNQEVRRVVGLDTETRDGKAFLIGADPGALTRIRSWDDLLRYQEAHRLDETVNFFYNLGFDAQALIKHLTDEELYELAATDRCRGDGYEVHLIPDKRLRVTVGKKHYDYYDLAQFYGHASLDSAANKFFGEGKESLEDEGVDIASLSPERYDRDPEYRGVLDRYLRRDVRLCRLLGERLQGLMLPYMKPKYYYSQASPAQQYYLEHAERDLGLPPRAVVQAALHAYNGGRFEVFRRGTFTHAVTYDIKSAYPYHNSLVPALDKGVWTHDDKVGEDELIGLYRVRAEGASHVSPLRHERPGLPLYYPDGRVTRWMNRSELDVIKDYGYDVKVLEAYHYHDKNPEYPFTFLKRFYDEKERVGKDNPDYMFYKLIINGFYGKTIQLQGEPYVSDDPTGATDELLHDGRIRYRHVRYKAGLLFNPVVAQEVTGNTRAQLLRAVIDRQESLVAFATDSITTTRRLSVKVGSRMGEWGVEAQGRYTVIGSGVAFYRHQERMKFRGFGKSYDPRTVLVGETSEVSLPVLRNSRLKSVARSGAGFDDLNVFARGERVMDLNFDNKRLWDDRFRRADDVYDKVIESRPRRVIA